MLIDLYQSGFDPQQFVALPTGHSLAVARVPDEPRFSDLQLCQQAADLTSDTLVVDVDKAVVEQQVNLNGYALFRGRLR